ncbi:MAG: hypothetical protein OEX14_13120, partial [Paracoccaceae bacterium]|nr:hypothetical protein [Paracoccaceae bacterium]
RADRSVILGQYCGIGHRHSPDRGGVALIGQVGKARQARVCKDVAIFLPILRRKTGANAFEDYQTGTSR